MFKKRCSINWISYKIFTRKSNLMKWLLLKKLPDFLSVVFKCRIIPRQGRGLWPRTFSKKVHRWRKNFGSPFSKNLTVFRNIHRFLVDLTVFNGSKTKKTNSRWCPLPATLRRAKKFSEDPLPGPHPKKDWRGRMCRMFCIVPIK